MLGGAKASKKKFKFFFDPPFVFFQAFARFFVRGSVRNVLEARGAAPVADAVPVAEPGAPEGGGGPSPRRRFQWWR
jgi:hypothetical protein